MKLLNLVEKVDVIEIKGSPDMEIRGIAYNSKAVGKGYIFVAIEGLITDGHNYISDALARGAEVIFVTKNIEIIENVVIVRVKDTRVALSALSSAFYGNPSEKLELIGVTGTNGKTTTSYFIQSILSTGIKNIGLIGTIGVVVNNKLVPTTHTTPESLELHGLFNSMVEAEVEVCIMEVSSHAIKLKRINDCDFNIGIFTNLTHEHLDFHKTMEVYYQVKRQLFLMTDRFNIINNDDPFGNRLVKDLINRKNGLVTYAIKTKGDITADDIILNHSGSQFTIVTPTGKIRIQIDFPGRYNIYNCLAAAACAFAMGIDLNKIKKGLEAIKSIPGRFEIVPTYRNFDVIIDYAHTPDGFENLLDTVREFAKGRIIIVFGCVGERDPSKRSVMGKIAAHYSDLCVLTTDNCRSEDPQKIIDDIKKGFSADTSYIEILDRALAIRYAILKNKQDDTILITGKGHELRQIIGNQVLYFNEKDIIQKSICELPK
ncbi:UDP-N-acetylmuramoyl-L-alanyl-D-glutamate--2,6-diaminopimelate ligase [Acetobacterium bakii]|uniref:UDP-N-acetylmuramyl-tripeptide synthetase n=1 Tax=Acetobacterium bakii TaxID=52689 RepID=A0A0L6U331_9FIRM|nr:UDP-N-acetylmuramoyl-L-alanyl-D-glutamate--2,6-diaminopimelate ligase [Acetobacterium bakii]KNZ42772.1 hypothetical protein AKG39_04920 [Acetobacterium bakii]